MGVVHVQVWKERAELCRRAFAPHRAVGTDGKRFFEIERVAVLGDEVSDRHGVVRGGWGVKADDVGKGIDADKAVMPREMEKPCLGIVAAAQVDNRPMRGYELRQVPIGLQESKKFVIDFKLGVWMPFHDGTPLLCWNDSGDCTGEFLITGRMKWECCVDIERSARQ